MNKGDSGLRGTRQHALSSLWLYGPRMRISVDGRHLGAGRGVARYTAELLPRMRALDPPDDWLVADLGRAGNAAAALVGRPRLGRGTDVLWLPAPAPTAVAAPYVLTVHDLSWVLRPQDFTAYERVWHRVARLRSLAEHAALLVAVSDATRDAIVSHWGIEERRVRVVRSGPGLAAGGAERGDPERRPQPYFLVVGALEPRKDPATAARALAIARERGLEAQLWFAGEGRLAGAVAGDGVRVLGRQDDGALHELYASALAVVHPALLEGFGFPPVEAAAHGTPSIVADIPVHAETIGDGALRFAAGDAGALAGAMLRLAGDAALRRELAAAGRAAIARLSWDRAAEQTRAALHEAAGC